MTTLNREIECLERAYIALLRLPFTRVRIERQQLLALARDVLAAELGENCEAVQNKYEAIASLPSHPEQGEREAFEKWYIEELEGLPSNLKRGEDGDYLYVKKLWKCWHAARASLPPASQEAIRNEVLDRLARGFELCFGRNEKIDVGYVIDNIRALQSHPSAPHQAQSEEDSLGVKLHSTMDAQVWATEFCRLTPQADFDLMLSWFANAIMCGYDTAKQQTPEHKAMVAAALSSSQSGKRGGE